MFSLEKVKDISTSGHVIENAYGEEITEFFYGKEVQKQNQSKIRFEKLIKKKGDELYLKRKGNDKSIYS